MSKDAAMTRLTLDTDKQVFFYEQNHYYLSNFSAFNLRWRGFIFPTSEHAYQWAKFASATSDRDQRLAYDVANAPSAHTAFKLAEEHRGRRRADWDAVKVETMLDILRCKARQHQYVRRKLLETGDRTLIESSWRDDFWGWGPERNGRNMLGILWMRVRDEVVGRSPPEGHQPEEDVTTARDALISAMLSALQGCVRVADRATDEFDAARAAIARAVAAGL